MLNGRYNVKRGIKRLRPRFPGVGNTNLELLISGCHLFTKTKQSLIHENEHPDNFINLHRDNAPILSVRYSMNLLLRNNRILYGHSDVGWFQ